MAQTKIIVQKKELGKVQFSIEGGGEVTLPNKMLPKGLEPESTCVVEVMTENVNNARKHDIAKALLDEILNPNEKTVKGSD